MKAVVRCGAGLLLAGVLSMWLLRWFEHAQVYHPTRELEAMPADLGRAFEEVRFTAADGLRLHGWFFPADPASPRPPLAWLVAHGNGGNLSHRLGLCAALLRTGASVLVFDYRGYGRSEGRPDEEGTYRDAQAAYRWLQGKGFPAEAILPYGESLGGAVAAELALRETVGGVVLQSTFTSIPELGAELFPWLPVRTLSTIRYDTRSKLSRLRVPLLVLHSRVDDLIPFHHAERNHAAAAEPKWLRELDGGHNDPVYDTPEFARALREFLGELESRRPGPPRASGASRVTPPPGGGGSGSL